MGAPGPARRRPAYLALSALLLAGCASTGGSSGAIPPVRYTSAVEAFTKPSIPRQDAYRELAAWRQVQADAGACGMSKDDLTSLGLVAGVQALGLLLGGSGPRPDPAAAAGSLVDAALERERAVIDGSPARCAEIREDFDRIRPVAAKLRAESERGMRWLERSAGEDQ